MKMRITVLGSDYEGLTISVGLTILGHTVTTFDINRKRTKMLQRGSPIPGDTLLTGELKLALREGRLHFASEPESTLAEADVVIIANIGNSSHTHHPDRNAILRTAECLSGAIASFRTVLVTCPVPTGSCRMLQDWLDDEVPTGKVDVVSAPVFFSHPNGLVDFLHPERIILGYETDRSRRVIDELFANLLLGDPQLFHVSWEAAEMMRSHETVIAAGIPDAKSSKPEPERHELSQMLVARSSILR